MFSMFRQILDLIDHTDRRRLGLIAAFALASVALETLGVGLVLPFLNLMGDPAEVHRHPLLQTAFELSGASSDQAFLKFATFGLFGTILIKNVVIGIGTYFQTWATQVMRANCSCRLFRRYLRAPYTFHLAQDSNNLIRNLSQSTGVVFATLMPSYLTLLTELAVVGGILGVLLLATPKIAIGVFGAAAMVFFAFHQAFKRLSASYGAKRSDLLSTWLKSATESFGALKELTVLGRQDFFERRYRRIDDTLTDVNTGVTVLNASPRLIVEGLAAIALLVAVVTILSNGGASGDVMSIMGLTGMAAMRLMPSLSRIMQSANAIQTGARFLADVRGYYHQLEDVGERTSKVRPFSQTLELRDVTFAYDGVERVAVRNVSLEVNRGRSLAVVGPSGAGKTTLADVLLGLLKPQSGSIVLDGKVLEKDEVLGAVAYVPQSIFILDDSLRHNVAFGVDTAEVDDARVMEAIRMAQLGDMLDTLPQGLDTVLGEKGMRMSGGQRQRVGIARALYHQPELLVLDEATAALDVETERRFSDTIHALNGAKTLIIIAHRLSTVRECDRIAFMENGELTGLAPFDVLYDQNQRFRDLVNLAELRPSHVLP